MDNPIPSDSIDFGALRKGLEEYLNAAMAALARRYPRPADLPHREVRGYHRPAPGHLAPHVRTAVYWRAVVRQSYEELDALHTTRKLLELLTAEQKHGLGYLVGADLFGVRQIHPGTFVRAVLELALTSGGTFETSSSGPAHAIEEAVRYLESSTVQFQVLAPLHGFQCEVAAIEIEPDLVIIRLTDEDWEWLDPTNLMVDTLTLGHEEFAIRRRIELPKRLDNLSRGRSLPDHDRRVQEDFSSVISCLRMFKAGAVGFSYYRWGPATWNPTSASVARSGSQPNRLVGSPYVITDADAVALEPLFRDWRAKVRGSGRLAAALRWFNSSYERLRVEERLVDYAIALEALVGDSEGDLTYRLSLRTAVLVGTSFDDRRDIAALVRELYKVRSRVVHGTRVETIIKKLRRAHDLGTFVTRCEALVRDAIRKHCQGCSPEQDERFITTLDDQMLGPAR